MMFFNFFISNQRPQSYKTFAPPQSLGNYLQARKQSQPLANLESLCTVVRLAYVSWAWLHHSVQVAQAFIHSRKGGKWVLVIIPTPHLVFFECLVRLLFDQPLHNNFSSLTMWAHECTHIYKPCYQSWPTVTLTWTGVPAHHKCVHQFFLCNNQDSWYAQQDSAVTLEIFRCSTMLIFSARLFSSPHQPSMVTFDDVHQETTCRIQKSYHSTLFCRHSVCVHMLANRILPIVE